MSLALASSPSHLLFDLDGTLSDPRPGIFSCFNRALIALGRSAVDHHELTACIGPPLEACFSHLLGSEDAQQISLAVQTFRDCYSNGNLFKNILHPGVIPLLQSLHDRGRTLFVVTAKKEEFARRILHHFHIDTFFTDIIGAGDTQSGDKEGLIAEIIRRHNLPAAATIMIGDRNHDIIGARANGIASYGVLWGFGSRRELTEAGPTKIIATLAELHTLL